MLELNMLGSSRLASFALVACVSVAAAAHEATILKDLARAELALTERRAEDAALAVADATRRVRAMPESDIRAELEQRVLALRDKADPVGKSCDAACTEAATALLHAALAYEDRGWLRSAKALLLRAAAIAPTVVSEALQRVRERQGQAAAATSDASHMAWLGDGEVVDGPSPWLVTAAGVTPAAPTSREPVGIYLAAHRVRSHRIRIDGEVTPSMDYGRGFVFAYRHSQDFHLALVKPSGSRQFARILRAGNGTYTTLAEDWLPSLPAPVVGATPPDASTPAPTQSLHLAVDGAAIEFRIGTVTLKATATEPLPDGFLGLQVEHTGKDGTAPRFTGLAFEAEMRR
jgi:hypothetical protein